MRQIGRITGNIGSAYIIIIGEIVAVKGRNAATFREGHYNRSGNLLRQIGRILGNIGSAFNIIIGELVAAKRRDAATDREVCGDK